MAYFFIIMGLIILIIALAIARLYIFNKLSCCCWHEDNNIQEIAELTY
jgi:hypothetical protein